MAEDDGDKGHFARLTRVSALGIVAFVVWKLLVMLDGLVQRAITLIPAGG